MDNRLKKIHSIDKLMEEDECTKCLANSRMLAEENQLLKARLEKLEKWFELRRTKNE